MIASVAFFLLNTIDFLVNVPGCILVTHTYSMSSTDTLIASLIVMFYRVLLQFSSLFYIQLYTAKARKSDKVLPVCSLSLLNAIDFLVNIPGSCSPFFA